MKRASKMKLKAFFIIYKWFSSKQTKEIFLEDDGPSLTSLIIRSLLELYHTAEGHLKP